MLALTTLAALASAATAEYTLIGSAIFGRHNDREAKPATILTSVGAQGQVSAGNFFRERYFGLSGANTTVSLDYKISGLNQYGVYNGTDFYAEASDGQVILYSHYAFLQGFYPPTAEIVDVEALTDAFQAQLSNGTEVSYPLGGYQYVQSNIQSDSSADVIWTKGDTNCPKLTAAQKAVFASEAFQEKNASTFDYYQSLYGLLPEKKFPKWKLNFGNAESVYDFINVNWIHSDEWHAKFNQLLVDEVTRLDDEYQWMVAYSTNSTIQKDLAIGGYSLLSHVYSLLNTTKVEGLPYVNYLTGSFNTMYQIYGALELNEVLDNFTGMPGYGAANVFELYKDDSGDVFVKFLFRNGSDVGTPLVEYPIFGSNTTMLPWSDFEAGINRRAILSLDDWCDACSATVNMCAGYSDLYEAAEKATSNGVDVEAVASGHYGSIPGWHSLSNAAAGGIGAGVTLGVVLLLAAAVYLFKRTSRKTKGDVEALPEDAVAELHKENGSTSGSA